MGGEEQCVRRIHIPGHVGVGLTLPPPLLESESSSACSANCGSRCITETRGALLRGGTIVDATLIAASPSTKNREGKRDPAMCSSKKGNQWYFDMKAHVGVDARSGLVHTRA